MNNIIYNARRRIASAATRTPSHTINNNMNMMHKQQNRSIYTTSYYLQAMPVGKTSPEEARTAQKKVMREKKGPSASKLAKESSAENKMYEIMIKAFDAPGGVIPKASEEEMAHRYNIGRNYVIGCFKRHNEINHDLAVKIRMKNYALEQLPREHYDLGDVQIIKDEKTGETESLYGKWKREALHIPKYLAPPEHRHIAMHTAPIEGFDINQYMISEEED